MAELLINWIPLEITKSTIPIYLSTTYIPGYSKRRVSFSLGSGIPEQIRKWVTATVDQTNRESSWFFGFSEHPSSTRVEVSTEEASYFLKPFIQHSLKDYFQRCDCLIQENFTRDIEVWLPKTTDPSGADQYQSYILKPVTQRGKHYLQLSLGNEHFILSRQPDNETTWKCSRYAKVEKSIIRVKDDTCLNIAFPVLNKAVRKVEGLPPERRKFQRPELTYKAYFREITQFYKQYLLDKEIGDSIRIFNSGFSRLDRNKLLQVSTDSNRMVFKGDHTDYNVYNGIKRYGPYYTPESVNQTKFFFIFCESDRDLARKLYKYLQQGLRGFPGLQQFVGIPFRVDGNITIVAPNEEQIYDAAASALQSVSSSNDHNLVAIYVSPVNKNDEDEERTGTYYRVKELLLSKGITSQVIYRDNIQKPEFSFYLPNIAIALHAKLKGIPWKLGRGHERTLTLGFGAKHIQGERYVGSTVCFDNSGVFTSFDSFQSTLSNLGTHIEKAVAEHSTRMSEGINRLVIHYYKDMRREEIRVVESVLSHLNISIPYVVLAINQTKTSDVICFDESFEGLMPVSGTIVELRDREEYLLFNNTRYSSSTTTQIDYSFPIKIKLSHANHVDVDDRAVVKQLIDQVYQFSRMYWRSIRQKPNPVTIEYSGMIPKQVFHFSKKELPDNPVARQSLWFI